MHFLATNGENIAKCGFRTTMEQNTFFKKELYSIKEKKYKITNNQNFLKRRLQPKIK